jgi:hypothetical protein
MGEAPVFSWRLVGVCGVLWGVVSSLSVSLTQAAGDVGALSWLLFVGRLLPPHIVCGLVWAGGTKLAEASRRPVLLVALTAAGAWASLVATTVADAGQIAPGNFGQLWRIPLADLAIYNVWTSSFYGGLYTLGFFATRRALRLRRRLAVYRVARVEAEAQLREARLRAVRGQLQPAMLLEALSALARCFAEGGEGGERLFDLLIAFLRAAMPGLRAGSSTLARELAILEHYNALRRALNNGPPEWRLSMQEPPEDVGFASLRLLPALDRMSRSAPPHATVEVLAMQEGSTFTLRINARASPPVPEVVLNRLRADMRLDLGLADSGGTTLVAPAVAVIRIPPAGEDPPAVPRETPVFETL